MTKHILSILWLAIGAFFMSTALADDIKQSLTEEIDFLPADEAFKVSIDDGNALSIIFEISPDYYLYKKSFKFSLIDNATQQKIPDALIADIPTGIKKNDPYFGEVETYEQQVVVRLRLAEGVAGLMKGQSYSIKYRYQGCAEQGLCYPPETKTFDIPKEFKWMQAKHTLNSEPAELNVQSKPSAEGFFSRFSNARGIEDFLSKNNIWLSLLLFLLLGIGLALTPCVLPMVPIISSIVLANSQLSTKRAFSLSSAYVLGMALTYACLGLVVSYFGAKANVQLYMQQPWVIMIIASLFFVLALSLFGVYELRLPQALQNKVNAFNQGSEGGSIVGVLVMGAISALVVSPCVSAPLAGVLLFIASSGDMFYGALSLFFLAIGMGLPLMLIGTLGQKYMPKTGAWMESIKKILGLMMIAVAIWLMQRIVPEIITSMVWLVWSVVFAAILFNLKAASKIIKVFLNIVAIAVLLYGFSGAYKNSLAFLTSGSASKASQTDVHIELVSNENAIQSFIENNASTYQYFVLDVYADWCVSCRIMEDAIFSQKQVHEELSHVKFLKYDASDITDEVKQFFTQYKIKGLPNIIIFDNHGQQLESARILGEMTREQFIAHIKSINTISGTN